MIIEGLIRVAGLSTIVIIALIFFFLLREGMPAFLDIRYVSSLGCAGIQ
ncbi:MAG: hypothetical protein R2867_25015 [Caldilineaceae bacterium]